MIKQFASGTGSPELAYGKAFQLQEWYMYTGTCTVYIYTVKALFSPPPPSIFKPPSLISIPPPPFGSQILSDFAMQPTSFSALITKMYIVQTPQHHRL